MISLSGKNFSEDIEEARNMENTQVDEIQLTESASFQIPRSPSVDADRGDTSSLPQAPGGSSRGTRRRSSIVNTTRRYSDANLATYEAFYLSSALLDKWDSDHKGFVTADEVKFDNVSPKFCAAIARIMAFGSDGKITIEHVAECISVLKSGQLQAKVKLLLQFMDEDGNGQVSYEEIKEYLRVADDKMMDRLGLSIQNNLKQEEENKQSTAERRPSNSAASAGQKKSVLTYEDILSLFQTSERGNEAITIFCEQILRVLTSGLSLFAPSEPITRRNSFAILGNEFSLPCISYFGCCSGWIKGAYVSIREFLRHVSHVQVFKVALIALQIFLWLFYFFYHKQRGYPLAFCFAKGFGLNLRILTLLVYFTMARTTMGKLYSLKLVRPVIPLGINIEVHSFIGFCIVMHAFGHTFGHIAYKEMHTKSGFETAFTQNSLLRGGNWEDKLKGDGKTGFILLGFLIIMGTTALLRSFSAVQYKWFYFCHFLYLLYLPMIFLHIPQLWPYFLAITALMVVERAFDLFQNTLYTTLAASRPCANGITFLSVPRYGMETYPGSYYRIRIPALSTEWHPFSLAGGTSSHHLYFFIASAGDWTRALHDLVSDPVKRSMTLVQVQGPFLAPASQALIRKPKARILCVASGIGITPFFSLMATKVTDEVNYDNERIMYRTLFAETKDGGIYTAERFKTERNSLLEVLQKQRKIANAVNEYNNSIVATKETSSSNFLTNIISAARRNTNTNVEAVAKGALLGTELLTGSKLNGAEGDNQSNSRSGSASVSRSGSNSNFLAIAVAAVTNCGSRTESGTNVLEHSHTNPTATAKYSEVHKEEVPRESFDLEQLMRGSDEDDDSEEESILKVVWSIRELSELSFYVDYVHHLVKAQEQLLNSRRKSRDGNDSYGGKDDKPRVVVEVEVFLTGLGSKSDPVYMLSQTLFLLSIAHTSSTYMKIHFGRPDLEKLVHEFRPEEVYYCGGNALKAKLSDVCRDSHIEFHPEDFDAGGGDTVQAIGNGLEYVRKQWFRLFPSCKPAANTDNSKNKNKKESQK
jgi:hypothetical protein